MSTRSRCSASATRSSISAAVIAGGFSTSTCLPASSARRASSACVGTGVATTTASSASSASSSSKSVVARACGKRPRVLARARRRPRRRSTRARRGCRSFARGWGPSSRGPLRALAFGSKLPDLVGAPARLAGGIPEVDDELGALDDVVVVDAGVVGDDGDAVVGRRVELRPTRARARAALGTCGSWYATTAPAFRSSSMTFSAGDSRVSEMSGLYATPSTSIFDPLSDRCRPWFRAWEITERQ